MNMKIPKIKNEWYQTVFGSGFEVVIYVEEAQHIDHITLIVNPESVENVKKILYGNRKSDRGNIKDKRRKPH